MYKKDWNLQIITEIKKIEIVQTRLNIYQVKILTRQDTAFQ